jgi:hypothetical protein
MRHPLTPLNATKVESSRVSLKFILTGNYPEHDLEQVLKSRVLIGCETLQKTARARARARARGLNLCP